MDGELCRKYTRRGTIANANAHGTNRTRPVTNGAQIYGIKGNQSYTFSTPHRRTERRKPCATHIPPTLAKQLYACGGCYAEK